MRGAFRIVTFRRINLFVHWTFLFVIGWVTLVNTRLENNIEQLVWSSLFVLGVFVCVVLHEFGHALVAARYGIKSKDIVLLPIGGIASIEKFPGNPKQEIAISIAGPLINIAIACLILLFLQPIESFWKIPQGLSIVHGHDLLYNLAMVNVGLAMFNLIPAFPLDGGRILRALLGFKFNYVRATSIARTIGKVVAVLFIAIGILLSSFILLLIGIFIFFSAGLEEYYLRLKALVKGIKVKEVLMYDYDSLQSNNTVKEAAGILMNNHSKYFIVMDGADPIGSINRMEIVKAIAEMRYDETVKHLMKENLNYLDGENDVETVLEKLASNDERLYPVMENSRFTGVISFNHIIEYLLIHKAETKDYGRVKSLVGLL
jgi:Zn-dependent protease/predicted transcriptional regulator